MSVINLIQKQALAEKVPIINDETLLYIIDLIEKNQIKQVLEIGSAVGYSAIRIALINNQIKITTIEKDYQRYQQALSNIKKMNLNKQIELIWADAKEINIDKQYDLIFIDAAKSSNKFFFEKFKKNLNTNGLIVIDNINFHGLLTAEIKNRNLKQLVKKINDFKKFLEENKEFKTTFINIGDGISISKKVR